jgi:carbon storage regulator
MESIQISDDIVVTVLEIHGNKVRIGIKTPAAIPICRTELLDAISGSPSSPIPGCVVLAK